jgi:two-component system response regulator MprA
MGRKVRGPDVAKILVVDDDQKLLNMVRRTLVYEGFEVVTATNGREALDRVQAEGPDLIILDWLMPEVDGIQVATHLRTADDDVPILMLTARGAVEDRVAGLNSGADDYLVKPFAPTELLARLRALLRRSKVTDKEKPLAYAGLYLDPVTREARARYWCGIVSWRKFGAMILEGRTMCLRCTSATCVEKQRPLANRA